MAEKKAPRAAKDRARSRTIFEISEDAQALDDLMFELGGDLSNEGDLEAFEAFFNEIEEQLEGKLEAYGALACEMKARAEARRERAKELSQRAKVDENSRSRLMKRLCEALQELGRDKVETESFRFSVCKNGGPMPIRFVTDDDAEMAALLPEEFLFYPPPIPDWALLREAIESGGDVPLVKMGDGIVPAGQIVEKGHHVRIS
jgi:hypothetical protein